MAMLGKQPTKMTMVPGSSMVSGPGNSSQPPPQASTPQPQTSIANTSAPSTSIAPNQTAYNVPGMTPGRMMNCN